MGEAATCEGTGSSSQFAEVMALKIALEHIQSITGLSICAYRCLDGI